LFDGVPPTGVAIERVEPTVIGEIGITSGNVVACDPLTIWQPTPFTRQAPTGRFLIDALIAHYEGGDQRIAIATLRFSDTRPVKWEMAVKDGQDLSSLKPDEIFGYGVDSGTGSFMDSEAAAELVRKMEESDDYFEDMIEEMDKTYVHTRSWATIRPNDNYDIAIFSSGCGDGVYASYWGLDSDGNACCLLTDFGLIYVPD